MLDPNKHLGADSIVPVTFPLLVEIPLAESAFDDDDDKDGDDDSADDADELGDDAAISRSQGMNETHDKNDGIPVPMTSPNQIGNSRFRVLWFQSRN